jgi:hypothetical protein
MHCRACRGVAHRRREIVSIEENAGDQTKVRIDKIEAIKASGRIPYAERFERKMLLSEAHIKPDGTANVRIAGRS